MIITPQKMVESVLKALEDSVKHFPKDEREEAKARILNAWSGQMFNMKMKEKK